MNPTWARRAFVIAVMAAHAVLLIISSRLHFATIDETGHIPAGLHHWNQGTFELYRVNPPLPRMIATLPVLLANPNTDFGSLNDVPGQRLEWTANKRFAENNKDRYIELIRIARLAGILWSLLGAWIAMRWSSELFGQRAGLLALVLWCFGPNVLAYAQLVTPDIPSTVAGLTACYFFRNYLRVPTWSNAWFAGLLLGIALLTRTTWLILFGLWPLLAIACSSNVRTRTAGRWISASCTPASAVPGASSICWTRPARASVRPRRTRPLSRSSSPSSIASHRSASRPGGR